MQQAPGITPDDRLLAITTISFDIAGLELYLPLVSGATVVLADAYAAKDGQELRRLVEAEKYHHHASHALELAHDARMPAGSSRLPLKVLSGGEALPLELAHRLLARSQEVWNLYGPTETTIWSSVQATKHSCRCGSDYRPPHCQHPVLHPRRARPARGPRARGGRALHCRRWGRAAATSTAPSPHGRKIHLLTRLSASRAALLYHTGDLGQLLPSGEIQCLGRLDQQMKVRGHRIEPAEIEHALMAFEEVREAVIGTHKPRPGDERLVAYIVPASPLPVAAGKALTGQWQKALRSQLPAYMVPTDFVLLAAMPLTLNGKIDRRALPAPSRPAAASPLVASYIGPRTDVEQLVAAIWQDCLGVAQVDVFDDFFSSAATRSSRCG